ncbi:diiron oxygenase [Aliinostoc sp. HNIBRCY26]|uniref:diiron oxygenase n=1 Tax=Aliinostoc sp. HNIBRCY26 TaxID=3418997 RepID=UPI003D087503
MSVQSLAYQPTKNIKNTRKSHHQEISYSRNLLQKMGGNWHQRAQVKTKIDQQSHPELIFDATKDDFRIDLLPFKSHPDFLAAPLEIQKKILSAGWIAYNEKTIDIESKVITPACNHIIYRNIPGVDDGISQEIASETLVDEAYHVLLVINACRMTRENRGLQSLRLPEFNLVRNMQIEQDCYAETWQKTLVQVATAIVSEVFISDYLDLLANDTTIQPFNRVTVATHKRDELAHAGIFKHLAKCIYSELNQQQKEFFIEVLPKPVLWFANVELRVWQAILEQIGFAKTESVIADCAATNEVNLLRIDYTELIDLAQEMGILESQRGIDSFSKAGLFN